LRCDGAGRIPFLAGAGVTPGLASRLSARLLKEFGSPEEVFRAPLPHLERCKLPAMLAQAVYKKQSFKRAEKELASTQRIDGNVEVLVQPSIGVVGTRRPTLYGTQMAEPLGREIAARGLVVVSGMARGVDAISHQGAMAVNGRAIGVLGTGVDVCYPKENRKLYEKVLERGAIISEFPLGTHPAPENFPIRNRIVAGMPLGVVVVEGAQYSGSLITARLAMEFGREVFAVPGNVTQPVSFAPNLLIKQGAKLVTNGEM